MPEAAITTYSKEAQRLYERGIAAARGGQRRIAAGLLTKAVQLDPRHEQAWLWLSGVLDDPKDTEFCLQAVLKLNPANGQAHKGLVWLQQRPPASAPQPATPSRIQQIEIPSSDVAEVVPLPAPEPQSWWQEWRSSVRTQRLFRLATLVGLVVLLLVTTLMLRAVAAKPVPMVAPLAEQIPTALPDRAGIIQQTILTAPEVNQALVLRYLSDVGRVRERIRLAAEAYRAISDVSTIAVEQIAAARAYRDVLRQVYTDLELIKPPTVLAAVHAEYTEGVQLEQAAFEDILEYYTNYNVAIANRAALRLQESSGHYNRAISGWATYQQELSVPRFGPTFGER